MRPLKLQVQTAINGFIGGPKGELDWMIWEWDTELNNFVDDLTNSIDTILLGRKMADGFISHWKGVAADPSHDDYKSGRKFTDTKKIVFSKTLEESPWDNVVIESELEKTIKSLKAMEGGDIMVYGGADFVSSLINKDLIDEYYLFVNPIAINQGLSIFKKIDQKKFILKQVRGFDCGIVLLRYKSKTHSD